MAYQIRSMEQKQALVAAWRASGMKKTPFATMNRLPVSAFSRWIERVERVEGRTQFVPVHVVEAEPAQRAPLVVELAGVGHRVLVPADFDAVALRRLMFDGLMSRWTSASGFPSGPSVSHAARSAWAAPSTISIAARSGGRTERRSP